MQSKINVIISIILILFLTSSFTGCIFDDINPFSTNYRTINISITQAEGFPVVYIKFESGNKVFLQTCDSDSNIIDEEFFYGSGNTTLNIGEYKETIKNKDITLRILDKNKNKIDQMEYSFNGPNVDIIRSNQYIWENNGNTSLIEIDAFLYNSGDVPVFPEKIKLYYNNQVYSNYILPDFVLPGSYNEISSFLYIPDIDESDDFILEIYDKNGLLVEKELIFNDFENVDTIKYKKGVDKDLTIPIPERLKEYYQDHERYYIDDYTAFIFNQHDDLFIDLFINLLIENLDFRKYFEYYTDAQKINKIGNFIQQLTYSKDFDGAERIEYPRFPIETLFNEECNGGGDCEDKAILAASLLKNDNLGYNVSLIRIPDHMAVGVNIDKTEVPKYDYYVQNYFFLDTSSSPSGESDLGYVHKDYKNPNEIDVYSLNSKAIIDHNWKNGSLTRYIISNDNMIIKVIVFISNLGDKKAENLELKSIFYTPFGLEISEETYNLPNIEPYSKIKKMISIEVPSGIECKFDTQIFMNNQQVSTQTLNSTIYA